ncbi:MAG: HAMP domain-containing sensor histidine kinase [bacterium]|nr:HAMP domain-containing sensor histidine kinase [bacterium]
MIPDALLHSILLERSSEGILIADADGILHTVNPAAAALLGLAIGQLIDRAAAQVFIKNAALLALFSRPGIVTLDIRLLKKRIAQGSGYPLPDGGRLITLRDVTEQRELDSRRESLVSAIAHDLRNPLSVIYAYLDLIAAAGGLNPDQAEHLVTARATTTRLQDILEDLVELAWIESGMPLRFQPTAFGDIIDRAIDTLTLKAHERGMAFAVSVQQPMPMVMGDADRLYTAVVHLIDNAIQYSEPGLLIAIHAWSDATEAAISVADRGFGISQDDLPLVFDRFYRSRDPRVQALSGSGLGLTSARRIAQRHGGSVTVTSTLDKGSTFTLTLPAVG